MQPPKNQPSQSTIPVTIENVKTSSGSRTLTPFRVEFLHGTLNVDNVSSIKAAIFPDSLTETETVAVCKSGETIYMGNSGTNQSKNQDVFVALRNKKTNKIRLVELSDISLVPKLTSPAPTNLLLKEENDANISGKRELAKQFVHQFGMLKGQRLYDQAERLSVKAETIKANLKHAAMASGAHVDEAVLERKKVDSFEHLLPPRNEQAMSASEVYQLKEIMHDEDYHDLEELAKQQLRGQELHSFSAHFIAELSRIKQSAQSDEEKLPLIAGLLYMESLIHLATIKGRKFSLTQGFPDYFPVALTERLVKKFSPSNSRNVARIDRDRIICHVIALALIVGESCSFDAGNLSKSLKIDVEKLTPLVRVVGARIVKETGKPAKVSLILPLVEIISGKKIMKKRGGK